MISEYAALIVGAILVNNFVLSRILGICPFLGVSKKLSTALGMGGAVIFVMTLSGLATALFHHLILIPLGLGYLQTIVFILVIAALVQIVEVLMQRFTPPLYRALGIFLPLITTNCAVLGSAIMCADNGYGIVKSTVFCSASAVGFALALVLFASVREKLELARIPEPLQGPSIALLTAATLAMAFSGFAGLGG
ncbi:MAG TPA: RnfABCDGE type electron transport complex subunit A [Lentisphaeria bacterium]|nr:RnfABCDGE type electron transport complex subunit A [Lentisphaerota bacterium]OQC13393.1 MAG: Electron transport complex protein RnfA [Lentisphaerae bacterium ADurb.Bin082]HQC52227.1 RnfABCDGE type electron transport complex subunit A [Lentisphaeria bacterium]HQL87403.1 RnfABCDGE type electron transport complex subunit A [Lentisphaeria bacterium]